MPVDHASPGSSRRHGASVAWLSLWARGGPDVPPMGANGADARAALVWPLALLLAGLLIAVAGALEQQRANEVLVRERLHATAVRTADRLSRRLRTYGYGLLGTRSAVITAGGSVEELSREHFRRYAASLDIPRQFPGLTGFSFARRVPARQEADFVAAMRREGFTDFRIRQLQLHSGERFVVQYIEPLAGNAPALGLDMASHPVRRDAALAAVDTGEARMTPPITLLQAPQGSGRAFALMLPIYRTVVVPEPAQRHEQAFGWVSALILIDQVLQDFDYEDDAVAMALTDATPGAEPVTFFTSSAWQAAAAIPLHQVELNLYGRQWRVQVQATPAFTERLNLRRPDSLGVTLAAVSALLALLLHVRLRVVQREHTITQQRAQLAAIVDSSHDAIIGHSSRDFILSWNPGAQRLLGWKVGEAIGRNLMELTVPPDRRGEALEVLSRVQRGEDVPPFDTVRLDSLGRPVDVSLSVSPVYANGSRTVTGAATTMRDMRAQRAAQARVQELNATLEQQVRERTAELEQALEREHTIFTSAGSAIITTDLDSHITGFNPAAEGMFGLPAAQALGRYFMELMDLEDVLRRAHLIPRVVREHARGLPLQVQDFMAPQPGLPPPEPEHSSEWTYLRANGTRFAGLLNVSLLRDYRGTVTGSLSVIADLTERRAAEEARSGFENVGRALPGILFTRVHRGQDFHYSFFSESAQRYLGVSRDELMADRGGRLWLRHVDEADVRRIVPLLDHAVEHCELLNMAYRVRGGDGHWRTLQALMVPRECGSDAVHIFDGIALDITELMDARTQALRASEAKDRFLAFMSHELRTPLNGILGFAQLLESQLASEDTRRFATHIRQAGQNLLRILNDVLDLSKIEAGRLELEQLPLRIEGVVQACQELFAPVAAAKGIAFDVSLPTSGTPDLLGDATRLQQVLANLLSNAIKFTPAGRVSLEVALQSAPHGTTLVRLQVSDTGIGLAQEQQEHLFEPFQQAQASTARRFGGTGLGLWICRSLVQAMHGDIALESAAGRGTTVRLSIPFKHAGQALPAPTADVRQRARTRALRVLVVDDIAINREVLRAVLQHRGHAVEELDNGDMAVERVAAGGIDLVLLDIEMPGLDGLEATQRIRALPAPVSITPIWVVTGRAYGHDIAQAHAAGADGHLSKPVDVQVLAQVLQAVEQGCDANKDRAAQHGPVGA